MKKAEIGSTVTISYIGTLDNGKIFQSTEDNAPLVFKIGSNQVFPALERSIIGMRAGDVKNVILEAEDAYGPRLSENIINISKDTLPAEKELLIGQKLSIDFKGGASRVMVVTGIGENIVTLDGNHPLAGLALTFALRVDKLE